MENTIWLKSEKNRKSTIFRDQWFSTGLLMEQLVTFAFEQNKNSDPNQDKWHNMMTVAS